MAARPGDARRSTAERDLSPARARQPGLSGERLTGREPAVLQLLPADLIQIQREIGAALILWQNRVKTTPAASTAPVGRHPRRGRGRTRSLGLR
jgi:hypothetical protein